MNNQLLIKRIGLFFLLYFSFVLLAQTSKGKEKLAQYYCWLGNTFVSTYYNGGNISYRPITKKEQAKFKDFDVLVFMTSEQQIESAKKQARLARKKTIDITPVHYPANSWVKMGIFFAFFFSLVICTPINWRQKLLSVFIGFILLSALVSFQFWIAVGSNINQYQEIFSAGFQNESIIFLIKKLNIIIQFMGFGLVTALIIWMVLCFKKVEVARTI